MRSSRTYDHLGRGRPRKKSRSGSRGKKKKTKEKPSAGGRRKSRSGSDAKQEEVSRLADDLKDSSAQDVEDQIIPTGGDGACFFRAIAYLLSPRADRRALLGTGHAAMGEKWVTTELRRLRREFVDGVVEKWDDDVAPSYLMEDLVKDEHGVRGVDEYRRFMECHASWAGQPEVYVAPQIIRGTLTVHVTRDQRGRAVHQSHSYGTRADGPQDMHVHLDRSVGHYSAT